MAALVEEIDARELAAARLCVPRRMGLQQPLEVRSSVFPIPKPMTMPEQTSNNGLLDALEVTAVRIPARMGRWL